MIAANGFAEAIGARICWFGELQHNPFALRNFVFALSTGTRKT